MLPELNHLDAGSGGDLRASPPAHTLATPDALPLSEYVAASTAAKQSRGVCQGSSAVRKSCATLLLVVVLLAASASAARPGLPADIRTLCKDAPLAARKPRPDVHLPPKPHDGKRPPPPPIGEPIYFSSSHTSIPQKTPAHKPLSRPKPKAPSRQTAPPDAFPYLNDIGLNHKMPFKSGMLPAGQTWDDAGLRPNVDPRIPSAMRPERQANSQKTMAEVGKTASGAGTAATSEHTTVADQGTAASQWNLKPEDPHQMSSDDTEAASIADEWSTQPSQAPQQGVNSPHELGAPIAGADPAILRWSSNLLSSGKQLWTWIRSGAKDRDGIALTMLKPKIHRPVLASLPLIPNDSKRDLVILIGLTITVVAIVVFLWSSRVSPEEFQRVKRIRASTSGSPRVVATQFADGSDSRDSTHLSPGQSSSYPYAGRSRASRRRNTGGHRRDSQGSDVYEIASEDEDLLDATDAGAVSSMHTPRFSGWTPAWLDKWSPWSDTWRAGKRRQSGPDGAISLPLLGDHSRSSTPRPSFLSNGTDEETAESQRWNLPTPAQSHTPRAQSSFAAAGSHLLSGDAAAALLTKVPFRSVTPQPQTQRQRERERSRERREAVRASKEREGDSLHHAGFTSLDHVESGNVRYASTSSSQATASPEAGSSHYWAVSGARPLGDEMPARTASANSHRSWRPASLYGHHGGAAASRTLDSSLASPNRLGSYTSHGIEKSQHLGDGTPGVLGSLSSRASASQHSGMPGRMMRSSTVTGAPQDRFVDVRCEAPLGLNGHQSSSTAKWKGKERDVWN